MPWNYKTTKSLSEVTDFLNDRDNRPATNGVHITLDDPDYHVWIWVEDATAPARRARDAFAAQNSTYTSHSLLWETSKKTHEEFEAQVLEQHGRESVIVAGFGTVDQGKALIYLVASDA